MRANPPLRNHTARLASFTVRRGPARCSRTPGPSFVCPKGGAPPDSCCLFRTWCLLVRHDVARAAKPLAGEVLLRTLVLSQKLLPIPLSNSGLVSCQQLAGRWQSASILCGAAIKLALLRPPRYRDCFPDRISPPSCTSAEDAKISCRAAANPGVPAVPHK